MLSGAQRSRSISTASLQQYLQILNQMGLQKITVRADGSTEPVIASGTAIILIQNQEAEVGRLILEEDDYGSISIEHPTNSDELKPEAATIVNQEPELLESQNSVIVLCSQEIASRMLWPD